MNDLNIKHSYIIKNKKYTNIINKYPDKIPIIVCDKYNKVQLKMLVPKNMCISQLAYIIRKKIKINEYEALYLLINNIMPNGNTMINTIYNKYRDPEGYIYIIYTKENTFG